MFEALVKNSRSCRRFHESIAVDDAVLTRLIALARLTPSAMNLQPLKYILVNDPAVRETVFDCITVWAGYLDDWKGPDPGERPGAYIIILGDKALGRDFDMDAGIAAQTILLGAREQGIGGVIIASVNKNRLKEQFQIPDALTVLLIIALGHPAETVVVEAARGDIQYWRDGSGIHHVPKRPVNELIFGRYLTKPMMESPS